MNNIAVFLKKRRVTISVVVLAILFVFEARYVITSIQSYYSQGELRPQYHHQEKVPITTNTANAGAVVKTPTVTGIQLWMTFDYLNVVFKLPPGYIKDILGINDPRYPNIRMDTYAKRNGIDSQVLLQTVKQYITAYKNH